MSITFERSQAEQVTINMTPLIDVIFLLLIFFMLSSTFIYPSVNLDLPTGEVKEGVQSEQHIVLSVDQNGQLFLNQNSLTIDDLAISLKEALAKTADKSVYFRADKKIPYEDFFKIMQISTKSGAAHFNLIHQPEQ